MSRLPEPGEAEAAADVLRDRLNAIGGDDDVFTVEINVKTEEMRGEEMPIRGVYGDLFVVGEMTQVAETPVRSFFFDIAMGRDPLVAMRSMYLLAVAHGCLMERARWEQRS